MLFLYTTQQAREPQHPSIFLRLSWVGFQWQQAKQDIPDSTSNSLEVQYEPTIKKAKEHLI